MNKPTNPFYTSVSKFIKGTKGRINYGALLGVLVGLVMTIMTIDIYAKNHTNYLVKIKSDVIGYVEKVEDFKTAVEAIRLTDGETPTKFLSLEKTKDLTTKFVSSFEIEKAARQSLNLKMAAVAVKINGEEAFKLRSQEDVDKVLEEVKKYYVSGIRAETVSILSSNIQEEIQVESIMVDPQEVLDINGAVQKIVDGKGEKKKYKIKNGDTIWDIALENGITPDEIHEANPDINLDKIKIDQEINLAVNVPYLNVEIVANVKSKEAVPYNTQTTTDTTIAKGVTKVKQNGKDGQSEIEKKITIVNGSITKEDVLKSTVLANAVDKVVIVGSKVSVKSYTPINVASLGSGQFAWPSRGSLTSSFGRRWGRSHTGLDIAGPTGTPVSAADSGTVVYTGYSGAYGNLIRINHGNGYETYYAHLSKIRVGVGDKVSKGELIGNVGSTGRSTGPHLHFEVRKNGTPVNPISFLQ